MGRRVLVTGLSSFWGGRVAQQLEADPGIDVIVGLDTEPPEVELERTEFVRVDQNYSILSRIVPATKVDTIIHTILVMNSGVVSSRTMKEINVMGTMNLFAAASAPESTVERVVVFQLFPQFGNIHTHASAVEVSIASPYFFQGDLTA